MRLEGSTSGSLNACLLLAAASIVPGVCAASGATAAEIRAATRPAQPPGYTIHALRIGVTRGAKRATFIDDPTLPERIDIAFAFWVIRGNARIILVDAGFTSAEMIRKWRVEEHRSPVTALAELGIEPQEVTDLVVTHRHWDHIGGLHHFAQATVWINERTLRWTQSKAPGSALARQLEAAEAAGRVHTTKGPTPIGPSIVIVPVGLHTSGFQYVVVHNPDGRWILASDIVPLYANLERMRATGLTAHAGKTREVMKAMLELVDGEKARIIPGHEPSLFARSPTVDVTGPRSTK